MHTPRECVRPTHLFRTRCTHACKIHSHPRPRPSIPSRRTHTPCVCMMSFLTNGVIRVVTQTVVRVTHLFSLRIRSGTFGLCSRVYTYVCMYVCVRVCVRVCSAGAETLVHGLFSNGEAGEVLRARGPGWTTSMARKTSSRRSPNAQ
jgi:hypothetical protein